MKSVPAWLCLLLPFVLGLGLDLTSKYLAFREYPAGLVTEITRDELGRIEVESIETRPLSSIIHLHAHVNYGAVFGIGQGQRVVFVVVSVLAVALLGYLFARSGSRWLYQFLLGLLFAGVMGNLYDRMALGYVRDMIYAFPGWRWSDLMSSLPGYEVFPWIFNIADTMLCTGVGAMFVYTTFSKDTALAQHPTAEPAEMAVK